MLHIAWLFSTARRGFTWLVVVVIGSVATIYMLNASDSDNQKSSYMLNASAVVKSEK